MPETAPPGEKFKCPYCGQPNMLESEFCWACYKKLQIPKEARLESEIKRDLNRLGGSAVLKAAAAQDAPAGAAKPGFASWGRMALVCGLFVFYLQWFKHENYSSFLDNVNLAFHEAGHIFLGFFGEFIGTAGGTIFQLLFPAICLFHFFRRGQRLGWQLCLFWLGENFLNISIYVGDAIKQELPLVGGGVHDWTYLLTEMGLIAHTEGTARVIFWAGSAIIFYSLYLIGNDAFKSR
ncbi:MAG: hypothetical protein KKH28_13735 [Elusimicrobia bacterium]|nr:hypothetical protein [Elusimicrobiota bacterium]